MFYLGSTTYMYIKYIFFMYNITYFAYDCVLNITHSIYVDLNIQVLIDIGLHANIKKILT